MSKRTSAILLLSFLFCIVPVSAQAVSNVAYETDKSIVLQYDGRRLTFVGQAPEFSPDGKKLAFLRQGSVYVLDIRTRKCGRITSHIPERPLDGYFRPRLRWHPSGDFLAYTRVQLYRFAPGRSVMVPVNAPATTDDYTYALSTIWIADLKTHETWRAVNLMGNFGLLSKTGQLEGASVYEPFLSPDGKYLGFVNAGSLFQQPFVGHRPAVRQTPKVVAWTGYLDLRSDGVSKAGAGVREVAWDARHHRLVYWIGRLWGSSWIKYGCINWRDKWGRAHDWNPPFADSILAVDPNIEGCAFDGQGRMWVSAWEASVHKFRWMRCDARDKLPIGADNPTFR